MQTNFDKPYVNYFVYHLDDNAAVLAMEVFDADQLVDVDVLTRYRADPTVCTATAIKENKEAIKNGSHVSQYRAKRRLREAA